MLLVDKINEIPKWSLKKERNKWCDYIELCCLQGLDKLITKDDVISLLLVGEDDSGRENHSSSYDKLVADIEALFEQINYRSKTITRFYPFDYADGCLSLKTALDENMLQYIFLLVASSLTFLDKSSSTIIAKDFEEYCINIFRFLVSQDSEVYIFGTSREGGIFTGNLRTRIEKLAECFGAQTTKTFDADSQFDVAGGDEGIDLVAFNKIDEATHIPIALGQCTCSYSKWEIKQEEINQDAWVQKIMPIAPFGKYMFVSFFCRDATGKFENPTTITTCLIDRLRMLKIIERHSQSVYERIDISEQSEKLKNYCGDDFGGDIWEHVKKGY